MAVGLIDFNTLTSIADAIRLKLETTNTFAPFEMADAIKSISNGGEGFDNVFLVGSIPLQNSYDDNMLYSIGPGIREAVITNAIPDDAKWSYKCDWPYSTGNVYCFCNNQNEGYLRTFGICLENGDYASNFSILDMSHLFEHCYNLRSSALPIGPMTTSMLNLYSDCSNLIGYPVCGDNVVQFSGAYSGCRNLLGQPVCGPMVINMTNAYNMCQNIEGSPAVGDNVVCAANAYNGCSNLTGDGYCPDSVLYSNEMYNSCVNLNGIGYVGSGSINYQRMYNNTNISRLVFNEGRLIYNGSPFGVVPASLQSVEVPEGGIVFNATFWNFGIEMEGRLPNSAIIAYNTFGGCYNLNSLYVGDNLLNMDSTFSTGWGMPIQNGEINPVVGNNVLIMHNAYNGQSLITGSPVASPVVRNMECAYLGCSNLTGNPVLPNTLGNTLIDISEIAAEYNLDPNSIITEWQMLPNGYACNSVYKNCFNLTGSPVIPPLMNSMNGTYYGCSNLTGNPAFSNNIVDANYLYYNCSNLTGSINLGNQVMYLMNTFRNADNVSSVYMPNNEKALRYDLYLMNTFNRSSNLTRLNVVVDNLSTYESMLVGDNRVFGCDLSLSSSVVDLANIEIEGVNIPVARYAHNVQKNVYLYCTN